MIIYDKDVQRDNSMQCRWGPQIGRRWLQMRIADWYTWTLSNVTRELTIIFFASWLYHVRHSFKNQRDIIMKNIDINLRFKTNLRCFWIKWNIIEVETKVIIQSEDTQKYFIFILSSPNISSVRKCNY